MSYRKRELRYQLSFDTRLSGAALGSWRTCRAKMAAQSLGANVPLQTTFSVQVMVCIHQCCKDNIEAVSILASFGSKILHYRWINLSRTTGPLLPVPPSVPVGPCNVNGTILDTSHYIEDVCECIPACSACEYGINTPINEEYQTRCTM